MVVCTPLKVTQEMGYTMHTIALKFGGSSLADAEHFCKVAAIVKADPARRFVVASAPGKRSSGDIKVTDLLYRCYDLAAAGESFGSVLEQIRARFDEIAHELKLDLDLTDEFDAIRLHLVQEPNRDYMASRGEYLNSKLLAAYLERPFIDPALYIRFDENGVYDADTTLRLLGGALADLDGAVIAGFYGALPDGTVHTFSRGGSDVTGAIVAAAIHADLYENWTDVSGMLAADPRVVREPKVIDYITYHELRELSYTGASVMHEEAVFPVRRAGISINIRNTNRPEDPGTMIVASMPSILRPRIVTGIAGKKGFSCILVEKSMMNGELGFAMRLMRILTDHGISIEHCPTGIDTMSVYVSTAELTPARDAVLREIRAELQPDTVIIEDDLALMAVVGQGMSYSKGIAARIFTALAEARINIHMIDQGSSEQNIIIGVQSEDLEDSIRAVYAAVIR